MKQFTVMGEHPGDGAVVSARTPIEAMYKFACLDGEYSLESFMEQIFSGDVTYTSGSEGTICGDYAIREVR